MIQSKRWDQHFGGPFSSSFLAVLLPLRWAVQGLRGYVTGALACPFLPFFQDVDIRVPGSPGYEGLLLGLLHRSLWFRVDQATGSHQSKHEKPPRGGVGGRRDGGQSLEVQVRVSTHTGKRPFTVQHRAGVGGVGRKLGSGCGLFLVSAQAHITVGLEFAFGGCLVCFFSLPPDGFLLPTHDALAHLWGLIRAESGG